MAEIIGERKVLDMAPVDMAVITGDMVNLVDTAEMIGDIVNLVDTMEMIGERMMLDMAPVDMAVITGKMVTLVDMAVIQYTDPVEEDTKMATEVDMAVGMLAINKDLDTETTGTTNRAEIMVDMAGTTNRLATEAAMAGIKRGPGILVDPPTTEEMVGDMSTRTPKLVDMEADLDPATMKNSSGYGYQGYVGKDNKQGGNGGSSGSGNYGGEYGNQGYDGYASKANNNGGNGGRSGYGGAYLDQQPLGVVYGEKSYNYEDKAQFDQLSINGYRKPGSKTK